MSTYLGFRLIEGAIARLPRRLAYALGVIASTLAFPLLARQRKALEANLHHVFPELPGPQLRKLAWRNWLNYTKAWIDFFKIPRMDRRRLGALLTPSGLEHLDAAMARGKGVIVVAPHMGSWELAAASWAASFGEIGVMVEQIEPRRLFDLCDVKVVGLSTAPDRKNRRAGLQGEGSGAGRKHRRPVEEGHPDATVTTVQVTRQRDQLVARKRLHDLAEAAGPQPNHFHPDPFARSDHELVEPTAGQLIGHRADRVAIDG